MTCDKCPHMQAVADALRPCQACDCGRLKGQVHVSPDNLDYAPRVFSDHVQGEGVTTLPPEVEDKLRKAIADLFGLSPIQLLMVQYMFRHAEGSSHPFAGFGEHLRDVAKKIRSYRGGTMDRSTSRKMTLAIARKFTALRSVFHSVVVGASGTAGRRS